MRIFFDTGVFIALFIENEKYHQQVVKKYQEYKNARALFLTSEYVLDELYTRLVYDFSAKVAAEKIKTLEKSINTQELRILNIEQKTFSEAVKVLLKFIEHKLSFTDATTYILFKEFKVDEIFTLDSGFKKIRAKTSF